MIMGAHDVSPRAREDGLASSNPKSRMISFRISDKEYEILKALHPHHGARNLSDFARTAMLRHLNSDPASGPVDAAVAATLQPAFEDLAGRVQQMQQDINRLTTMLLSKQMEQKSANAAEAPALEKARAASAS